MTADANEKEVIDISNSDMASAVTHNYILLGAITDLESLHSEVFYEFGSVQSQRGSHNGIY